MKCEIIFNTNLLRYTIILLFTEIVFLSELSAQDYNISDFKISENNFTETIKIDNDSFAGFLFSNYKKYVSSQDIHHCVYTPSCSVFALETSKKYGLLVSLPRIFDRLSRCNHEQAKKYKKDAETGLALDYP